MRATTAAVALAAIAAIVLPRAFAATDTPMDAAAIAHLAEKAALADVRDRPYLYARLVRAGTDLAGREMGNGDTEQAADALRSVENYANALDISLDARARKLREAEILLRESAFSLRSELKSASLEDRPAMAEALKQIDDAEAKVMEAVFEH